MSNIPCIRCNWDPTLTVLGSWLLELPVEALSINKLRSNTRASFSYRRRRDEFSSLVKARCGHIPHAEHKRRVIFTRHYCPPKRAFDYLNLVAGAKSYMDTLKMNKLVVDDSPRWVEDHYRQLVSATNHVSVLVEDIAEWARSTKR